MPAVANAMAGIFLLTLSCINPAKNKITASAKKASLIMLPIFFSKKSSEAEISKKVIPAKRRITEKVNFFDSNSLNAVGSKTAPAKK